jgi:hypothetical protein
MVFIKTLKVFETFRASFSVSLGGKYQAARLRGNSFH